VDLAGSERLARSEAAGARLREAQAINKSLAALGDTLEALDKRAAHVPFRNSQLTHLLADALGGAARTVLVAAVAPAHATADETLFSLAVRGGGGGAGGSLSLVDLAGSERLARSGAEGERKKEAAAINKSLAALGDVFAALAAKAPHVPFRNSKLTHLLAPCLRGDVEAAAARARKAAGARRGAGGCVPRARTEDADDGKVRGDVVFHFFVVAAQARQQLRAAQTVPRAKVDGGGVRLEQRAAAAAAAAALQLQVLLPEQKLRRHDLLQGLVLPHVAVQQPRRKLAVVLRARARGGRAGG